ncbi:MAG: Adenine deaminase [Chlamydiae bacterium]|nr:Adenine deaminase [Chlamydiota bacterium]
MEVHGKIVDIHNREIFPAVITAENGIITRIERNSHRGKHFIMPGLIDAHVHLESCFLPPSEFARMTVRHGSVAAVIDTGAMAKALGISGVEYLVGNAQKTPFKFSFAAPTSLPEGEIDELLAQSPFVSLGEVKSTEDPIHIAKKYEKRVDGHLSDIFGENLKAFHDAGIESDHGCNTLSAARERHALGMKLLIDEGALNSLFPIMQESPENCLFCRDYLQPDQLLVGHMNLLVRKAIQKGMDPIDAIKIGSQNAVEHYKLDVGLLRVGDPADFIMVENLESLRVLETYIDGRCVFKETNLISRIEPRAVHRKVPVATIEEDPRVKGAIGLSTAEGIIAVGKDDVQLLVQALEKGGLGICYEGKLDLLPLPIGGLFSNLEGEEVAIRYSNLNEIAKTRGASFTERFFHHPN